MNTQQTSIRLITIERLPDDTSCLGEYSNTPDKVHIDRKARGEQGRNEYRYFNLGCGDADYIEADYKRMEALNRGDWHFIGIRAKAEIVVAGVCQTISSGGLWGIESDSGEDYLKDIEAQEMLNLQEILEAIGFTPEQITEAV